MASYFIDKMRCFARFDALIKLATLLKVTLLDGCFLRFLNYINDNKLRNILYKAKRVVICEWKVFRFRNF